ncbi:MAG TPA: class I SAM-dependent methyltransferase [Anaeromyxobacteraceae bacterium]|nr:class I SAM-dependent methyltransferase [Anaeromyxobacteraceae bacterium]
MARRNVSIHDRERWVFNRLARDYRARPGYPAALVTRLAALAGGPGRRVAELGAGTGLLAVALAREGLAVHAVEPASEMLDVLAEDARGLDVVPVHGSAEVSSLTEGGFELVVLADALQWVHLDRCAREAARLLAPGGVLAVVDPRPARTPFMTALGDRIAASNFKARPQPLPIDLFFSVALAATPTVERFDDEAALDDAGLEGVLRSISYVGPALGPAALDALLADARALARAHGGAGWRREISLSWCSRSGKAVVPCAP